MEETKCLEKISEWYRDDCRGTELMRLVTKILYKNTLTCLLQYEIIKKPLKKTCKYGTNFDIYGEVWKNWTLCGLLIKFFKK